MPDFENIKQELNDVIHCAEGALSHVESAEGYANVDPEDADDTDIPNAEHALDAAITDLNGPQSLADIERLIGEARGELRR